MPCPPSKYRPPPIPNTHEVFPLVKGRQKPYRLTLKRPQSKGCRLRRMTSENYQSEDAPNAGHGTDQVISESVVGLERQPLLQHPPSFDQVGDNLKIKPDHLPRHRIEACTTTFL